MNQKIFQCLSIHNTMWISTKYDLTNDKLWFCKGKTCAKDSISILQSLVGCCLYIILYRLIFSILYLIVIMEEGKEDWLQRVGAWDRCHFNVCSHFHLSLDGHRVSTLLGKNETADEIFVLQAKIFSNNPLSVVVPPSGNPAPYI